MSWRLAKSLDQLRRQVNAAYPNRSKYADGTIGDAAHARTDSEHNPNSAGVIRAIDITHDPTNGVQGQRLANDVIAELDRRGVRGYVIHAGRIRSTYVQRGVWRRYGGSNPHNTHVHVSILNGYDNTATWSLPTFAPAPAVVSMGGGMTAPIGGARIPAKTATTQAPEWPLPPRHLIYHNPKRYSTWHDGHGNDTEGRAAIKTWQQRMRDRGWSITPDGYYGPSTEKVVRDFQTEKRLGTDGIIGPKTWAAAWTSNIT